MMAGAASALTPTIRKEDLNLRLQCPDCRDEVPNIIEEYSSGDLVCGNCGMVLGNRIIDTRSEWRTFSNSDEGGDDPSRVGAAVNPLLGGQLESTIISRKDGGTGISRDLNRAQAKMSALKSEKALMHGFKEIQALGERIGLPKVVIDSAKQLYKKSEDEKTLKGRTQEAIMASCIYLACREHSVTRSFKEICALTKVSKKEIGRVYKLMQPLLGNPTQQISMESYISRFASQLDLPQDVRARTATIAQRASDLGTLAGKSPITIVAACLYFVAAISDTPKNAKEIADAVNTTDTTLRSAYRLLYEKRYELVPKDSRMYAKLDQLPTT
ncbi:cyclin-like protein [Cladochytrium replicatum]|nr:cyclin-like protein [Cladochytrium replicatum]